jgi:hypothetical protein
MKFTSSAKKASHKTKPNPDLLASAGLEGVALVPPAYGMEVVDRGPLLQRTAAAPAEQQRLLPSGAIQAKLAINHPGDSYEQEADRVAEQVMRMSAPAALPLQRKCVCGGDAGPDGECAACKAKRLGIQRRAANHAEPSTAPAIVHEVLGRSGQPLDPATRSYFEPRFGADFSGVRVRTDARAAESARAANALAYTAGRDVVFGAGQYQPGTLAGKKLLAHELTHVVQQKQMISPQIQRQPNPTKKSPQDLIDEANLERIKKLEMAYWTIFPLDQALQDQSYDRSKLTKDFPVAVKALGKWLNIKPSNSAFQQVANTATRLIERNWALGIKQVKPFYQAPTGPQSSMGRVECATPAYAWSTTDQADISCCDPFINTGPNCRRDVLIHEHFHILGIGEQADKKRASITPEQAPDSADNLAQLVLELNEIGTDNCPKNK